MTPTSESTFTATTKSILSSTETMENSFNKVRSTGAALKIASHKLKEYADYSIDNGYDWSKTQAQAEKLLSDKKNLMYLNMVLGNK